MMEFFLSMLLGAFIAIFLVWMPLDQSKLNECAKQHNVYACEYVAVPKKEGAE